jgi:hypothetical protein
VIEDQYREQARSEIFDSIERGSPHEWFNLSTYPELDNRTPSEAWAAGDRDAVVELVDSWYEATERAVERHRADPEFMQMLRDRSAAIAAKRSA